MKNKKIWKFVLLCIIIMDILGCSGCGKHSDVTEIRKLPQIIIGSDNYPPYNYEDSNGKPTGIDVELAKEAFGRMGYDPVFTYINWEDKKNLLEDGDIDCIWGSFSIDGREDQYRWTSPYMISRQVIAVSKDSDIHTLADLRNKRVAVQSTTKPEEIFLAKKDNRIPELKEVISLQNRELIYSFLSKGYVDAIAAHQTAILQCMKDYDLEYRILDEPLLTVGLGVAFANSDERGLEKELSNTLEEMKQDGTTAKIIGKYLDNPESYLEVDADEE